MAPTDSTNSVKHRQPRHRQQTESTAQTESAEPETHCSECGGQLIKDGKTKELHCQSCGIVVKDDTIDRGPEWRNFDNEPNKSRVGSPLTEARHDRGLSTEISWNDKDGHGNTLSAKQREKMGRLRKWDKRFKTKNQKERGVKKAISEILRMSSALGLPDSVTETASVIYRRASSEDLIHGYAIESIASGALYISARTEEIPRTFDEIESVSRISRDKIRWAQMHLRRELKLRVEPADPLEYIPRYCSKLDTDHDVQREATRLAKEFIHNTDASGLGPSNIAAAAVYTATFRHEQDLTQVAVEKTCGTTPPTVRKISKMLIDVDPESDLSADQLQDINTTDIPDRLEPIPP